MRRIFVFCCVAFCLNVFGLCAENKYQGRWTGALSLNGSELELVFNIAGECTLDVPAQGAKGISASLSQLPGGVVRIDVPSIGAYYEGMFLINRFVGTFHQNGMEFSLTLMGGVPQKPNRPQMPKAPFPYKTEDVIFAKGSAMLSGTLTMPEDGDLSTPVVLLVTGSGAQNRDEELFDHKPFAVIADAFARKGIASLRYDDRGFAKSTGDLASATTDTLAADAAAGIAYLRGRGYKTVGVVGHSEGGTIAFMLAAEGNVDFIISMAGMVEGGEATLLAQTVARTLAGGATEAQAQEYARKVVAEFRMAGNAWMSRFLRLDPVQYVKSAKCRVLAINGEKDIQVLADRNIPLVKSLLPAAETKIYPNLNHLFQHCDNVLDSYYDIEETISPEVLSDMIEWIKR